VTIHLAALLSTGPTTVTTVAATAHKAGTSILEPIAKPIAWVLAEIYSVIPNYGVAIMVLSVLWMVIISPLTLKSTRSMLAMQQLQPQLKKLQEQHKNDKAAFAQAQMDLFRENQVSPFGSCLPMLLPMPVFFALFRVIQGLGRLYPKYLSPSSKMYHNIHNAGGKLDAFGMNLSQNAFSHHSSVLAALPFWILVLVMAGTGYLQSSQMMSRNPNAAQNPQMRMMKYLPLVFTIFFIRFPAGVLLYYAMSNVCRIVQQDFMYRFDPKVKALVVKDILEVEEHTHEIDERGGTSGPSSRGPSAPPPVRGPSGPKGGGNGSGGKGGGGAGVQTPSGGRSRFRDMLAAAAEQQKGQGQPKKSIESGADTGQASRDKPPSNGSGPAATGSGPAGAGSNGATAKGQPANGKQGSAGRTGASSNGQRRTRKSSPGGHRTNRKRRGK
jgi:YidC/Oxa1 family membrane protein insertase